MVPPLLHPGEARRPLALPTHPRDGAVYGVALNHRPQLERLGPVLHDAPYKAPPTAPVLYLKPANTLATPGAVLHLPQGCAGACIGGTIGVVFARPATAVTEAEALEHIAGYTLAADVFLPHASFYRPAIREQCLDGSCRLGPDLVAAEAVPDPATLTVSVALNDRPALSWTLADLVRPLPRLIAEVSAFMTLRPGDILLAGVPDQVPVAAPGTRVSVTCPPLGRLDFTIAGDAP